MANTSSESARKIALVTGASAGIGKAIAHRLLRDGWIVYGAARRTDAMADLAAAGARVIALDVTDEASAQAAVATVRDAHGRLDALINSAGYGSYGAIEDVPIAEARRQFDVNVFGLVRLSQLVLPLMRGAGRGRIINISSMGGRIWMPIGGWYHATKHALEALSDALRVEARPFGVDVVVIQPGVIASEWAGIAAANLARSAAGSAYADQIAPMAAVLGDVRGAADPEVVATAVARALAARRPRRRYATPFDAKLLIALRWLLPDAAWEWMIRRELGRRARQVARRPDAGPVAAATAAPAPIADRPAATAGR